jgi:hypothetical protein
MQSLMGRPERKRTLGRPRMLQKYDGVVWTGVIRLRIGTSSRRFEHDSELWEVP